MERGEGKQSCYYHAIFMVIESVDTACGGWFVGSVVDVARNVLSFCQ